METESFGMKYIFSQDRDNLPSQLGGDKADRSNDLANTTNWYQSVDFLRSFLSRGSEAQFLPQV